MSTGWSIEGTDLRTLGYDIEASDDWDSFPGSKYNKVQHPYRTGMAVGTRFYSERYLALSMLVLPRPPSGPLTVTPLEHLQTNIDTLLGLFHSNPSITVTKTLPDGSTTRTIEAVTVDSFTIKDSFENSLVRRFTARMLLPYPFWDQGSQKNVTGIGSLALTNNGNAPIHNAVVTFNSVGRLTVDATGDYIEASGTNVIVDMGAWTVTQTGSPADNLLTHNRPWLVLFQPGTNNLTATANVDIDFYDSYF